MKLKYSRVSLIFRLLTAFRLLNQRNLFIIAPYIAQPRPTYTLLPTNILYNQSFNLKVRVSRRTKVITAVIMDLGFATHAVHMNQRSVELRAEGVGRRLIVQGPPIASLLYVFHCVFLRTVLKRILSFSPPGYAWLYILADGVPSIGQRVMIGSGKI